MTRHVLARQRDRRWAVLTAAAGTVFIAAGAFWLSFMALADLAERSGIGSGQAWAWPLIVDGIIVVATVAVVALAGQRTSWYPWALLIGGAAVSVTANAIHAVVAADTDVPAVLAACVAAVPPVVLLAITHLTVILTRPPEPNDDLEPVQPQAPPAAEPELITLTSPTAATPVKSAPEIEASPRDRIGPASTAGRRERARELRDLGWSNRRIATELDVHPSTVGRWFAAEHLSDTTEPGTVEEANEP